MKLEVYGVCDRAWNEGIYAVQDFASLLDIFDDSKRAIPPYEAQHREPRGEIEIDEGLLKKLTPGSGRETVLRVIAHPESQ